MSYKKYNKKKQKPIFNKKSSALPAIKGILMVLLVVALIVVGFLVAKPLFSLFERPQPSNTGDSQSVSTNSTDSSAATTTEPTQTTLPVTEEPIVQPVANSGILYAQKENRGDLSYEDYILSLVEKAKAENNVGICIELITVGGHLQYNSANELAIAAEALSSTGVLDLSAVCKAITDAGLKPYARITGLSDNMVSWYTKDVTYMIEGSTSRWLDNKMEKGGKPWLSPFSQTARDYMAAISSEISSFGFEGLIVGELEFPPFRNSDLEYIGDSVKSAQRYLALAEFANVISQNFNGDFYIDVKACDVIAGDAEILTDISKLPTTNVYVSFFADDIPETIKRSDGTKVSFKGLNGEYKIKTAFKLVNEALTGVNVTPVIGCDAENQEFLLESAKEYYKAEGIILSVIE